MNVKKIIFESFKISITGMIVSSILYFYRKRIKILNENNARSKVYYNLINRWIMNKNNNKSILNYFKNHNIKKLSIYGAGTLGELLYEEIKDSDIEIKSFIDIEAKSFDQIDSIHVIKIDEIKKEENLDAIVITPIYDYNKIVKDLKDNGVNQNFISLEDIIYDI